MRRLGPWSERRKRWQARLAHDAAALWPDAGPAAKVRIASELRRRTTTCLAHGVVTAGAARRSFWIKWAPADDRRALRQSAERMGWWYEHHPTLRVHVPRILSYWPDENALVIAGHSGVRLDRLLHHGAMEAVERALHGLGRWLRAYADAPTTSQAGIAPLCDDEIEPAPDGTCCTHARQKLRRRVAAGQQYGAALVARGHLAAHDWATQFDIGRVLAEVSDAEPGGYVHGDCKPENVLVVGEDFALIDWWGTPRLGWPILDVASFAANLWCRGGVRAARAWRAFAQGYFGVPPDERTAVLLDVLGTVCALGTLRQRAGLTGVRRLVAHRWCVRVLRRLTNPATSVGAWCRAAWASGGAS